ncbi:hypothetical protein pb186bvf_002476 [Paramecium bursaria]
MLDNFVQAELVKKEKLTHDTFMFGFSSKADIKVDPGDHFVFKVHQNGEDVERRYTPILSEENYFEVPIKIYPDGQMTQYLNNIKINQSLSIEKRVGKIKYYGTNKFMIQSKSRTFSRILMICGGTGITPAYALIKQMLGLQESLNIHLLYANKTEGDILLKTQLLNYQQNFSSRFFYNDILNQQPDYNGLKGFVTRDIISQVFPKPDELTLATHCGPRAMNLLVSEELKQLGYKNIIKF